jgi:hypothetical protein
MEALRLKEGIRTLDAVTNMYDSMTGYLQPKSYLCSPITMYQARARNGIQDGKITLHYTRRFQASVIERYVF